MSLAKSAKFDKKFKTDLFILEIGRTDNPQPRFGVVVPAKFCKKAHARNRTKRLVSEGLNFLKDKVKVANYKILVRADFSKLTKQQVCQNLEKAFVKAGFING